MTMRITAQMVDNSTVGTIDTDLNQLNETEEQLSTGFQINEPSDNPYGAAETLSLQGQISAYSAYTTNINQGVAWVQTTSQSLESIQQVSQSVQELALEGSNGTMSATDLKDAAAEVQQYIGQIKETADAQYDGSYIFSGDAVDTQPYNASATGSDAYEATDSGGNPNQDSISYAIGPSTTLPINANLYSVLGSGVTSTGTDSSLQADGSGGMLATLNSIYNDLESGNQSDLGTQVQNLDTNMNDLEGLQAQVGSTQDRLQLASSRITALTTTDQTELGNVYDTDEAVATTTFSTEQAGYQAALQSTADIIQTSLLNFLQS